MGSRTFVLPPQGQPPDDYDFPYDDEGSDELDESLSPNVPYGKDGGGNGGRRRNCPKDPDDPDDDDPDGDGGGGAPIRMGKTPNAKTAQN